MKEIFDKIWNASGDQVFQWASQFLLLYAIGTALSLFLAYCLWKYVKKKMGFGKEWDKRWKDFDDKFKNFGG